MDRNVLAIALKIGENFVVIIEAKNLKCVDF